MMTHLGLCTSWGRGELDFYFLFFCRSFNLLASEMGVFFPQRTAPEKPPTGGVGVGVGVGGKNGGVQFVITNQPHYHHFRGGTLPCHEHDMDWGGGGNSVLYREN